MDGIGLAEVGGGERGLAGYCQQPCFN
jgi:hypothetical protein